jgi:hypothetical protein
MSNRRTKKTATSWKSLRCIARLSDADLLQLDRSCALRMKKRTPSPQIT